MAWRLQQDLACWIGLETPLTRFLLVVERGITGGEDVRAESQQLHSMLHRIVTPVSTGPSSLPLFVATTNPSIFYPPCCSKSRGWTFMLHRCLNCYLHSLVWRWKWLKMHCSFLVGVLPRTRRGVTATQRVTWHWAGASSQRSLGQVDRLWRGSVFDGVSFRLFFIEVFWNRSYQSWIDLVSLKLWSTEDSLYLWMMEMSIVISVVSSWTTRMPRWTPAIIGSFPSSKAWGFIK